MFFSISHNVSGEENIRRLSPTENKNVKQLAKEWLAKSYDGAVVMDETNKGYIPNGCGEYTAEIRHTKKSSGSCWESLDFFTKYVGG